MTKIKIVKCFDNETKKDIANRYAAGNVSQAYLASEYGVSVDTIARVLKEVKSWDIQEKTVTVLAEADEAIAHLDNVIASDKQALSCTWMANSKFLSVTIGSETYNASGDHPKFMEIISLLREEKYDEAMEMLNIKRGLERYVSGDLVIEGGTLKYKDLVIDSGLTRRIVDKMWNGEPFEPLVAFFENLMSNPSRRAVYQLYDFLEHNDIEITDDGHFIAWKRVDSNFKDMYTGQFDNSPGTIVKVNRFQVDEDPNVTCSHGLHVAAKSYIPHYGGGRGKVIACKVNPADVVAIPTDYNNAKMRCAGYEVLYEVTSDFKEMKHY